MLMYGRHGTQWRVWVGYHESIVLEERERERERENGQSVGAITISVILLHMTKLTMALIFLHMGIAH